MAAKMNRCRDSLVKTSQAGIPNGFKSQEHLRPWNKMFTRKKIDKNPHLLLDEGVSPQNTMAGEKLQTNGHYQPRCSHQGLSTDINSSFEANQSLPEVSSKKLYSKSKPVPSKLNHSLNIGEKAYKYCQTNGDCQSSHALLSEDVDTKKFSKEAPKSPPAPCNGDMANQSEADILSFSKFIGLNGVNDNSILPSTIRNPNKAVCTIDAKSSQILTANEMACALFGYDRADMIRKRLIDLIQLKKKDEKTIMESYLQPNGEVISITGKVVDAIDKNGLVLPVSLWMKRLDYNKKSRCLVAMEPAHRLVCSMFFDIKGTILSCEEKLTCLYGFTDSEDIIGMNIHQLIPGFRLPTSSYRISKNVKKQRATGRALDGSVFPLSVHVQSVSMSSSGEEEEERNKSCCSKSNLANKSEEVYEAIICVFSSITGLITFFPDGTIHSVNHHFALMLFGYSSLELIGKNVSLLIPEFYSIISSINIQDKPLTPISPVNSSMTRSSIGEMFSPAKLKKKGAKFHCSDLMSAEKRRFSDIASDHRSVNKEWQSHLLNMKPKDSSTPCRMSARLKLNEISDNSSSEDGRISLEHLEPEPVPYDPQCSDIDTCSDDDECNHLPVVPPRDSDAQVNTGSESSSQIQPQSIKSQVSPCKRVNNSSAFSTVPNSKTTESFEDRCKNLSSAKNSQSEKPNSKHVSYPMEDFSETLQTSKKTNSLSEKEFLNPKESDKIQINKQEINSNSSSSAIMLSPRKGHKIFTSSEAMVRLEPELALIDAKMEALCVDCDSSLTGYSSADVEDEDLEEKKPNATFLPSIPGKNSSLTKRATDIIPPQALHLQEQCLASSDDGSLPKVTITQSEEFSDNQSSKRNTKMVSPRKTFSEKTKIERMIASPETLDSDEDSFEFFEREIEKAYQNKESANGYLLDYLDSSNEEIFSESNVSSPSQNPLNNSKSVNKSSAANLLFRTCQKRINVTPENEEAPEIEMSLNQVLGGGGGGKKTVANYHKTAIQNSLLQWQNKNNVVATGDMGTFQENLSPLDENVDGDFAGVCQHKDGSLIAINFSVNPMHLETGELMFCLWVSQDLDKSSINNFTLDFTSTSNEDSANITDSQVCSSGSFGGGKTAEGVEESYPPCKAFDHSYQNLRTIGHGAFGFVVESLEQSTKMEVIVKYILRSKVLSENWRDDPSLGQIPLEVSLLSQLSHPNIVQVLNVFDSKDYILMVMEKHGSGMDLFEFIEHKPNMDEGLHSYIFRQLVSAVAYLHQCGIVHRDIKDENIIVNEHFHIKLIDFGSAAYMEPGKMFATFCGTVEYCSPEVLMGNWYDGPELEVWSMGVTLYTLVYGENPFFTVDDILACNFKPPFQVSEYLTDLLCWMLLPDPADRMTVKELETDAWVFQPIDMTQYSWQEIMALSDGPTVPDYEVIYDEPSSEEVLQLSCINPLPSVHSRSTRLVPRPHFMSC